MRVTLTHGTNGVPATVASKTARGNASPCGSSSTEFIHRIRVMGLSLDAIYKPLNDFFLKEFGATVGAPVKFRFAHTAHTLVDGDFIPPLHPEFGPSSSMAVQIFSISELRIISRVRRS